VHISIILYCLSKDEDDIPAEPVIKGVNPYYTRAKAKQLFHKNIIVLSSDDDETMDIHDNTGLDNDDQLELNDKRKHKEKSKVYSPEHTQHNYSAQHSSDISDQDMEQDDNYNCEEEVERPSAKKKKSSSTRRRNHYTISTDKITPLLTQQLTEFQEWMAQPINFTRQMPYFEAATIEKTLSTIKRILGYINTEEGVEDPNMLTFLKLPLIEKYLGWLMQTRGLQPQSIITILNTVINVTKV